MKGQQLLELVTVQCHSLPGILVCELRCKEPPATVLICSTIHVRSLEENDYNEVTRVAMAPSQVSGKGGLCNTTISSATCPSCRQRKRVPDKIQGRDATPDLAHQDFSEID